MEHTKKFNMVGALFQGVAFFTAFICITSFYIIRYRLFRTHDQNISLIANHSSNNEVTVGLHISHFSDFDIPKNRFVLDGTVWFDFDPQIVSLEKIKQFDVFNGTLLKKSDPTIKQFENKTIALFRIRAEFHTPLNYRLFPFDDHKIHFIISNHLLPKNVTFHSDITDMTFAKTLFLPGWHILELHVQSGTQKAILTHGKENNVDQQQEVVFTLKSERADPSIILNMILTLLLMLFVAMLTFSSTEDSVLIVTVGIVALVGYRSVMQAMAPPQVSYFMYSDFLYLYALIGVIVTLFAGIMTQDKRSSIAVKKSLIIGIYTLFVVASIATFFIL